MVGARKGGSKEYNIRLKKKGAHVGADTRTSRARRAGKRRPGNINEEHCSRQVGPLGLLGEGRTGEQMQPGTSILQVDGKGWEGGKQDSNKSYIPCDVMLSGGIEGGISGSMR